MYLKKKKYNKLAQNLLFWLQFFLLHDLLCLCLALSTHSFNRIRHKRFQHLIPFFFGAWDAFVGFGQVFIANSIEYTTLNCNHLPSWMCISKSWRELSIQNINATKCTLQFFLSSSQTKEEEEEKPYCCRLLKSELCLQQYNKVWLSECRKRQNRHNQLRERIQSILYLCMFYADCQSDFTAHRKPMCISLCVHV